MKSYIFKITEALNGYTLETEDCLFVYESLCGVTRHVESCFKTTEVKKELLAPNGLPFLKGTQRWLAKDGSILITTERSSGSFTSRRPDGKAEFCHSDDRSDEDYRISLLSNQRVRLLGELLGEAP